VQAVKKAETEQFTKTFQQATNLIGKKTKEGEKLRKIKEQSLQKRIQVQEQKAISSQRSMMGKQSSSRGPVYTSREQYGHNTLMSSLSQAKYVNGPGMVHSIST